MTMTRTCSFFGMVSALSRPAPRVYFKSPFKITLPHSAQTCASAKIRVESKLRMFAGDTTCECVRFVVVARWGRGLVSPPPYILLWFPIDVL